MKQINYQRIFYLLMFPILTMSSCSDNEELVSNGMQDIEISQRKNSVYAFASREDIISVVNSNTDIATRATVVDNNDNILKESENSVNNKTEVLLLTDKVLPNDPILNEVSEEEKKIILDEGMTYYDMYGCEDYIPSENFAKILNSKREIQLKDSIYKITEFGTLRTLRKNSKKLDLAYNMLKADTTIALSDKDFVPVTKDVVLHPYKEMALLESSNAPIQTRTTSADIPTSSFNHYSAESKTWFGKQLGSIFGDRSVKHHEFMKERRVNGSLYSYNYLVYYETGAFVSMSRKRGGFFKFINGWKDINADELFMQYKGLLLELNLDVPQGLIPSKPTQAKPIVDSYSDLSIHGFNLIHKSVNVIGYDIREKDLYKYIGKGAKELYQILKNQVGNPQTLQEFFGADKSVPAINIMTPDRVYVIIADATYNPKSPKKYRKVFNSGTKFYITFSNLSFGWSDLIKSIKETQDIPIKKLCGGEVLLAGKLDGKWGGMYIKKEK